MTRADEYWREIAGSVQRGMQQGEKRLAAARLRVDKPTYESTEALIYNYLNLEREPYTEWFWEWATEAVMIAVGARIANEEPALEEDDARQLIDTLSEFANSFRHSR